MKEEDKMTETKVMPPHLRRRRIWILILAVLAVIVVGTAIYIGSYYHADGSAMDAVQRPVAGVETEDSEGDWITFRKAEPTGTGGEDASSIGLIFYPGGKVQYESYGPLMEMLAKEDIVCVLVHMPGNLAVLDKDAAEDVMAAYPDIREWYIGGHSLGGVMAAAFAGDRTEALEGVFFLGSYTTEDLSDSGLKGLTLTGSEDGVLDRKKYEENRGNLPAGTVEVTIPGGNHAGFGSYGPQKGDGEASISPEAQQESTAAALTEWIREQE